MDPTVQTVRRVAIITGAAEGIGRGIALRLARDGLDLGLFDLPRSHDKLEELTEHIQKEYGVRVLSVYGDVSVEEDVKRLVETVVQNLGDLYAMIANAGIALFHLFHPLHEVPTEVFDQVMNVNVKGTFFSYKYAAMQLIKQKQGGRIVGAASIASKQGSRAGSVYCASKFAIRGLTQSAAMDYGKYGITVNAYAPGTIDTPLVAQLDDLLSTRLGQPKGAYTKEQSTSNVLKRLGRPEDVANLVSFLISDDSAFITGQTYLVDGGVCFD